MTDRQFRILVNILLHILISTGVKRRDYEKFEREVEEAMLASENES